MTPKPRPKPNLTPGVVEVGCIYTAVEFARRLRWKTHSLRCAKRRGLPFTRFGSRDYIVVDQELLTWFRGLDQQQDEP